MKVFEKEARGTSTNGTRSWVMIVNEFLANRKSVYNMPSSYKLPISRLKVDKLSNTFYSDIVSASDGAKWISLCRPTYCRRWKRLDGI